MPQYTTGQGSDPASSGNIFNLSIEQFENLQAKGISLDQLFILEQARSQRIHEEAFVSERTKASIQTLKRKALLSEGGSITVAGKAVLATAFSLGADIPARIQISDDGFELWWKAFPSTDMFEYKDRSFKGDRGLRQKKEECKRMYRKILNEGEFTAQDLIRALEYEVLLKKEASIREGENKLKYLRNTHSYLNGRVFENFIEISKQKKPAQRGSTNIDV